MLLDKYMNTESFSPKVDTVVPEEGILRTIFIMSKTLFYAVDNNGKYSIRDEYIQREKSKLIAEALDKYNNIYCDIDIDYYYTEYTVEITIQIKYARYSTKPTILALFNNDSKLQKLYDEIMDENQYLRSKANSYELRNKLYYKEINELQEKLNNTIWKRFVRWWTGENSYR